MPVAFGFVSRYTLSAIYFETCCYVYLFTEVLTTAAVTASSNRWSCQPRCFREHNGRGFAVLSMSISPSLGHTASRPVCAQDLGTVSYITRTTNWSWFNERTCFDLRRFGPHALNLFLPQLRAMIHTAVRACQHAQLWASGAGGGGGH
jgi:hypothetical protein